MQNDGILDLLFSLASIRKILAIILFKTRVLKKVLLGKRSLLLDNNWKIPNKITI